MESWIDNTTGSNNTATGESALFSNTCGAFDTKDVTQLPIVRFCPYVEISLRLTNCTFTRA
jgi:hypothetical protein